MILNPFLIPLLLFQIDFAFFSSQGEGVSGTPLISPMSGASYVLPQGLGKYNAFGSVF